jgi:leucine dehydrogenase
VADMERVARATRHVAGLTQKPGQAGGDPSPWTAQGVYEAMAVAAERRLGKPLSECRVAIQGLGNVGSALAQMLFDTGATLVVADPFVSLAARSSAWYNAAQVVSSETIMTAEVDIFAPCALGGALNTVSISTLRAKVVCGAANNQLATEADGVLLSNRGVLYAPDYVVNAGGIINVAAEYLGWSESEVLLQVKKIAPRLTDVFNAADDWGISTKEAADRIARKTIADGEKFSKGLSGISSAVEFRERS